MCISIVLVSKFLSSIPQIFLRICSLVTVLPAEEINKVRISNSLVVKRTSSSLRVHVRFDVSIDKFPTDKTSLFLRRLK